MKLIPLLFLVAILLLAGFFRLWQLDSIPPGLFGDEAINAVEAKQAAESDEYQLFYQENFGREGLYINLIAFIFGALGVSMVSFKLLGAVLGIITVFGQYLFTKEALGRWKEKFNTTTVALFSAFFLAISFWHVNFSRIGFRAIFVPFILVFSFYFLFRGFRTKQWYDFALAGLVFGIGLHTYISFRLAPLALALALLLWLFVAISEKWGTRYLLSGILLGAFLLLSASPMLLHFVQNPDDFFSRTSEVSVFSEENPAKALAESTTKHLGMFHIYGDPNWRHNYSGWPQLLPPVGLFFLIGLAVAAKNMVSSRASFAVVVSVLGLGFAMLLPGILTSEGIPHALRTIGAIPTAYLFAGLGAFVVWQWMQLFWAKKHWSRASAAIVLLLFLALLAAFSYYQYFISWPQQPEVKDSFSQPLP